MILTCYSTVFFSALAHAIIRRAVITALIRGGGGGGGGVNIIVDFGQLFTLTFGTSLQILEIRCEVQKFISEFASQFVNKDCDWPLNSTKPIKFLVYKPTCEYLKRTFVLRNEFPNSQRSSKCYSGKLFEIDNNMLVFFPPLSKP